MTILIVDDYEQNLYQLQVLLGGNGYQVVTAANGAEALAKARQQPPDLIVSDILMPVMDGFALCREWKKDERLRLIPFVFYTATYTEGKDREFALSLGAERFLVKPEEPDVFMQTIRDVLKAVQRSPAAPIAAPPAEDAGYLKQYNAALIRKLEAKMQALEHTNRELAQEVSEHKRAEDELRLRNIILATQQEASIDGILVVDENGAIISANRRFADTWGIPSDVVAAKSDEQALQAVMDKLSEPNAFLRKVRHLYQARDEVSRDEITLKDGRIFDRYSAPMHGDDGNYYGRVWYFRDITQSKQEEATRAKLEAQLHQAQKMEAVGRLAGGVAHDFNNMLQTILGNADLALEDVPAAGSLRESILEIQAAAKRSAELTMQLLAFARKQVTAPKVLDLNDAVGVMLKMLRRLIGEDIELQWKPAADLWPVTMDPGQLNQVLANLAVNARDAIAGVGTLTIDVGNVELDAADCQAHPEATPGAYVLLAVRDTGCGMDQQVMERIFEPFFTTKEVGKGTGLGLAMVYGIVKQNHGFICVTSEPGKGTTFRIYLPRHMPADALMDLAADRHTHTLVTGTETMLLVEDDSALLRSCRRLVEGLGYTVLSADSPQAALRLADSYAGEIHLVLTDVIMPEMSGRQLQERLAAARPGIKCLFMSGYTADTLAPHGVLERNVHFLQKPFSREALATKLREVLSR